MKQIQNHKIHPCIVAFGIFYSSTFPQSILDNTQQRFFTHTEVTSSGDSTNTRSTAMEIADVKSGTPEVNARKNNTL